MFRAALLAAFATIALLTLVRADPQVDAFMKGFNEGKSKPQSTPPVRNPGGVAIPYPNTATRNLATPTSERTRTNLAPKQRN